MSDSRMFLEKIRIKNYRSLKDVTLPFKPLTVLVGANASGKSNVLKALLLLKAMIVQETPPPVEYIRNFVWARAVDHFSFNLYTGGKKMPTSYELKLEAVADDSTVTEALTVGNVKVISLENGSRLIRDEDGKNETVYRANKLALKSAGDYGNKPVTSTLTKFISGWKFYDFEPDAIRGYHKGLEDIVLHGLSAAHEPVVLDSDGSRLSALLSNWYQTDRERFDKVSDALSACTHISVKHCEIDGSKQLCLFEGYKNPLPLEAASDGTLRLIAYYVLLNEPEVPPLIAIEEPERNLHPGVLADIVYVLEKLSERTQVIITTHSSQILDAFNRESLSDFLGVLLLRNRSGIGTEALNLEAVQHKREALDGWIADFGIGSAIFDSELLKDLMREPI